MGYITQRRNIYLVASICLHLGLALWLIWPVSNAVIIMPSQQIVTIEFVASQANIPSEKPVIKHSQPIIKPKAKNPEIVKKEQQEDKPTKTQEIIEEKMVSSASGEILSDSDHTKNASTTEPVFNAVYLNNPPPIYPPVARRQNIEGQVLLKVVVSENGLADFVEIKNSSGSLLLDNAAIDAVRRWRFVPAKQNNIPVAANVMVPVVFKIQG